MISEDGKQWVSSSLFFLTRSMATTVLVGGLPGERSELRIGGWDCEVDHAITFEE
jgi:hypothetical protein